MTHCTENTALVPIEENQICALFLRFFVDLHLFDKAPSSDGKWVDKLRQKRRHGLSVGSWAVSLSINDIICPPDVFVPVTLVAHELKEEGGGKEMSFSLIRAVWMKKHWGQFVSN